MKTKAELEKERCNSHFDYNPEMKCTHGAEGDDLVINSLDCTCYIKVGCDERIEYDSYEFTELEKETKELE